MCIDLLQELMNWFEAQCNNDWEHGTGISIETIDNPGWSINIDLVGTNMENIVFNDILVDNGDNDWYFCRVEDNTFKGRGDSYKLKKLLSIFVTWIKN